MADGYIQLTCFEYDSNLYFGRYSFSMVKWANDGLLQDNDDKLLVNDGERLDNYGEMTVKSYNNFTIINTFHQHKRAFHHH